MKTIIRFLTEIFAPRTIEQLRQMPRRTVAARMCVSLAVLPLTLLALLAGGCTFDAQQPTSGDDVIDPAVPFDPDFPEVEPTELPPTPISCSLVAIGDAGLGKDPQIAGNGNGFGISAWLTTPGTFAQLTQRVIEADGTPIGPTLFPVSADFPHQHRLTADDDGFVSMVISGPYRNFFFVGADGSDAGLLTNEVRPSAIVPDGDRGALLWSERVDGCDVLKRGALGTEGVCHAEEVTPIACGADAFPTWEISKAASGADGDVAVGLSEDDVGGLDVASVIVVRADGGSHGVELGSVPHDDFTFAHVASVIAIDEGFAVLWSIGDVQTWEIDEHLTLLGSDGGVVNDVVLDVPSTYWRHELAWNGKAFGLVSNHAYSSETIFRRLAADGTIAETIPVFAGDGWNRPAHMAVSGTAFGIVRESADGHVDFASYACE